MSSIRLSAFLAMVTSMGLQHSFAQAWTSPYTSPTSTGTCTGLNPGLNADFKATPVVSRALFPAVNPLRITKMTFWLNPTTGKSDIYMAEKGGANVAGRVLYYNGTDKTLKSIGTIPNVYIGFNEQGVTGIALNPKTFSSDNFLYILYSYGASQNPSPTNGFRISRFKINATTKIMDLASEKILLHVPAGTANRWHTGSSMQFDNFGNLYISIGDNESEANGPANTADFRGSILRIKPDVSAAKSYTIPTGNFGEYWAQQWQSQGLTARAAAYRDTAIVKPEIYVKGTRNAYGTSTDKNRLGLIAWSECGPDIQRSEEFNLTSNPAFSGWPFWVGNTVRQLGFADAYNEALEPNTAPAWELFNPSSMKTSLPINNWANAKGYDTLPPMHKPTHTEPSGCAQGGPIIRYDGSINNPAKMPPHLDNTVMYTNLSSGNYIATKFNPTNGTSVGTVATVFAFLSRSTTEPALGNSIDYQQGPDGELYLVNWGAGCCDGDRPASVTEGIVRISYTGTCQDPGLVPVAVNPQITRSNVKWLHVGNKSFSVFTDGPHDIQILNAQGKRLHSFKGEGSRDYALPTTLSRTSIHFLKAKTNQGMLLREFLVF